MPKQCSIRSIQRCTHIIPPWEHCTRSSRKLNPLSAVAQVIGIIEQDLADAEFTKTPRKKVALTLDFLHPPALKKMKRLVKKQAEDNQNAGNQPPQKLESTGVDEQGRKQYKIPDAPKKLENEQGADKKKKVRSEMSSPLEAVLSTLDKKQSGLVSLLTP